MTSENIVNSSGELRDNLITTAVKFLTNPNVQKCTFESKEKFLRSKGLTDPEIQKAIEKCADIVDLPSLTSEVTFFQHTSRSWIRDHVVPIVIYGGCIYSLYWFYKNYIKNLIFVDQPRQKSTAECLDELRRSMDILNSNITALRSDVQAVSHGTNTAAIRTQIDDIKGDITSVKGILLNRNQFPSLKSRTEPPSIPAWQRQAEEATSSVAVGPGPSGDDDKPKRRTRRSESGGSNSSEGEHATKNSDSSLEIMKTETDMPKRPMSAYMLWLNSARERIKSENPGLKVTEMAKKGGELWRAMKDKSVWEEKAAKAKEQYTKDLESYNVNGGGGGDENAPKRGKKGKIVAAPKFKEKNEEDEESE